MITHNTPTTKPSKPTKLQTLLNIQQKQSYLEALQTTTQKNILPNIPVTPIITPSDIPTVEQLSSIDKKTHLLNKTNNGEYTPTSFNSLLYNIPGTTPPKYNNKNLHIPSTIIKILSTQEQPLAPNPWIFDTSSKAATANTMLAESFNFDMESATQTPENTILSYGSEFRDISTIAFILKHHPDWSTIKDIITRGASYPLRNLSEADRIKDIKFHLQRGNHQSTVLKENKLALFKAFRKEVKSQWAIPLLPSAIPLIPGASITPLGVAVQWSMNAAGDRILKRRTAHDCTFPGPSGESCNLRVIKDDVPDCKYGHALYRFLHGISEIRRRHPNTPILITKTDMDAAYRRIHATMQAAVTCITILANIAYLLTRLPFGSAPAPALFSIISDSATDLAWDLALDPTWDTTTLQSNFDFLDSTPQLSNTHTEFGKADPLLITLPPRDIIADNFIDDIFMAAVAIANNHQWITHAVPLALECLFRPSSPQDATQRSEIINRTKHLAEGPPSETKIILGWKIDTRTFQVHLTANKHADWINDINRAMSTKKCTKGELETMIGRFNHVGTIIHTSRYFLTRLRYRLHQHQHAPKFHPIRLAPWDIKDLHLWHTHINHLHHRGANINNICLSKPSTITYSDACEWGLGGFTSQGHAWRYKLPTHLQHRASINLLEFMAAIITIQLSLDYDTPTSQHPHILAFTDNSSALGWMYHSTFDPVKFPNHDATARYLANLLLKAQASLHPEHVPGTHNEIADCLSRDFQLNDSHLICLLQNSQDTSPKLPNNFTLHKPSTTIISWVASTLQSMPPTKPSPPQQMPSTIAVSFYSNHSSKNATSTTPSWINTTQTKNPSSCVHSPTASGKTTTNHPTKQSWQEVQSLPPSRTWFRPSGKIFGPTPPLIIPEQNLSSSPTKSRSTRTKTHPPNTNLASP